MTVLLLLYILMLKSPVILGYILTKCFWLLLIWLCTNACIYMSVFPVEFTALLHSQ